MTPPTPTHYPLSFRVQICVKHNSLKPPSPPSCSPPPNSPPACASLPLWWRGEKWHTFVHVNQLLLLLLALLLLALCFLLRQLGSLDLLLHLPLLVVLLHCFLMRHARAHTHTRAHAQAHRNRHTDRHTQIKSESSSCHHHSFYCRRYCIVFRRGSMPSANSYSEKGLIVRR